MSNSWDTVYAVDEYVYGREPNAFLKDSVELLTPGNVLCIAEGEGRNAVFLAQQGFNVTAVDSSHVGLKKVQQLAEEAGVSVNTVHADLADYDTGVAKWRNIVSIFCHLPGSLRAKLHRKLCQSLKPGGVLLLEGYSPEQLKFKTGGPPSEEMLYSKAVIENDFSPLEFLRLEQLERRVVEGTKHTGLASVVQLIATRPAEINK